MCERIGGILVPAGALSPHKSVFGTCTDRLERIFPESILSQMPAIELGLSADTRLADRIRENHWRTYLTNSDAHSLPKIAREYNILRMAEPSFVEFEKALWRREGRGVSANYGLDPKLGKYHRTCCRECEWICVGEPPVTRCERCGSASVDMGVLDRIATIADLPEPSHPDHRPPYHYQVPLQFLPGIGTVALNKLLNRFGSEMAVLHKAPIEEIRQVVGSRAAARLMEARNGELHLIAGGGGKYGRVATKKDKGQLSLL